MKGFEIFWTEENGREVYVRFLDKSEEWIKNHVEKMNQEYQWRHKYQGNFPYHHEYREVELVTK